VDGDLDADADLRVEGVVRGTVRVRDHRLIVGLHAIVDAEIHARSVIVRGEVVGEITATDRVEVLPTGTVRGTIRARRVILADGARFDGVINDEHRAPSLPTPLRPAAPRQPSPNRTGPSRRTGEVRVVSPGEPHGA